MSEFVDQDPQDTNVSDVCGKCGTPLSDGQEFCPMCGTRKGSPPVNTCDKCGATLQEYQLFCGKCGQNVGLAFDPSDAAAAIDQAPPQASSQAHATSQTAPQSKPTTVKMSKNKIIIPIIAAVAVIVIALIGVYVNNAIQAKKVEDAKDMYISDIRSFKIQLLTAGKNLEDIADTVQKYWYENIYDDLHGSNIDSAIWEALRDKAGEIDTAEIQKTKIDELYKNIKSVPELVKDDEDLRELNSAAKELYNAYTDYYSFATIPKGSYNSFSEKNENKKDTFLIEYMALDNLVD